MAQNDEALEHVRAPRDVITSMRTVIYKLALGFDAADSYKVLPYAQQMGRKVTIAASPEARRGVQLPAGSDHVAKHSFIAQNDLRIHLLRSCPELLESELQDYAEINKTHCFRHSGFPNILAIMKSESQSCGLCLNILPSCYMTRDEPFERPCS
jgi:hypothetical protein